MLKHLSLLALMACSVVSCQQKKDYPVLFLTESSGAESGATFNLVYGGHYYNRMPVLSLKQFESFRSFLNPDDGTYGMVLTVKDEYRMRLYSTTLENQGRRIIPLVNGFAFEPTLIDRGISDGKVVIWRGLTGYDLKRIADTVKPADPELEEKRFLDDDPRPKPVEPTKKGAKDKGGRFFRELHSGY